MTIKELEDLVDHEIQWLSYYGYREDRNNLNLNSEIYRDVRSIGYTKRVIDLYLRCSPGLITSDIEISKDTIIDKLRRESFPRGNNKFTPLEVYLLIFPDRKEDIINRLKIK